MHYMSTRIEGRDQREGLRGFARGSEETRIGKCANSMRPLPSGYACAMHERAGGPDSRTGYSSLRWPPQLCNYPASPDTEL